MVNNQAKLADFGLAIYVKHINKVYEFCGTPGFIAPEVSLE
jgi:serine/threonine protein kinase